MIYIKIVGSAHVWCFFGVDVTFLRIWPWMGRRAEMKFCTGHSRIDDLWWLFDNVWKFSIVFSLKVIQVINMYINIVQFLGQIRVDGSKPTCWSDLHVCWLTSDFPKLLITYFVIHCSARLKWHPHWNHHLFFSGLRWIGHFNFWLKSTCLSMLRKSQGAVWPAASYAGAKAAIERGRCREHCFWTPDRCRLRQLAGYSLVGRG